MRTARRIGRVGAALVSVALIVACSEGGSGVGAPPPTSSPPPTPSPPASPPPPSGVFDSNAKTARFLTQATFGPMEGDVAQLTGTEAADWFVSELGKPATLHLPYIQSIIAEDEAADPVGERGYYSFSSPGMAFWRNAISADDQLRQRMAFALSEILVISTTVDELLIFPEAVGYYQDILTRNAFGNYRDLLEEVTYSPAMGYFLTYLQNQKGDAATGRVPDENYAREIMQLFSIGLVELTPTGEPVMNGGEPVETYTNDDITGLARVFTGLSLSGPNFFYRFDELDQGALTSPMQMFPAFHSDLEKSFLGTTIPAGTGGTESIDMALDAIFDHPNVGPFIGRQLIQRFVTSDPSPAYVGRVTAAFDTGTYTLPDGTGVGEGRRGDLAATIAAVLFDDEARADAAANANAFGKVREPVLRFVHWARAFDAQTITPEHTITLWDTSSPGALAQHPYRAPSVFNFYRPGYIAPGTQSGDAGMTVPELQIVNASSVAGYANFMTFFALEFSRFAQDNTFVTANDAQNSLRPDYTDEIALADDPAALVSHLDDLLTYGMMSDETKSEIETAIENIALANGDPDYDGARFRVQIAVLMAMTSPDYIVQR